MDAEEVLVRGGGDGETVELLGPDGGAGGRHVLPGQEPVVRRPVELDLDHVGGKQLCLEDVELHVAAVEADHLVQGEHEAGHEEEDPELGRGGDARQAVHQAQQVQEHVELVAQPEEPVGSLPDGRQGEDEDHDDDAVQGHPRHPRHCLEEPEADVGRGARREEYLLRSDM